MFWDITINALLNLWQGVISFVPKLIIAIVVFLIGYFISVGIGKLIEEILKRLKFNKLFEKENLKKAMEKADIKLDASKFVGDIFKWILVIVFLSAAAEILGLMQFSSFLYSILRYLPNVIAAVLIFIVAVIIADILEKITKASIESIKVGYGNVAGAIVKWSILILAALMILAQLGINTMLIQTLWGGIVALVVISAGLAFGLGGKDIAAEILKDLKDKIKK